MAEGGKPIVLNEGDSIAHGYDRMAQQAVDRALTAVRGRYETDKPFRDALRAPFDEAQVGHLPRVWCKDCRDKGGRRACAQHKEVACRKCGNRMTEAHMDLAYVSHAQVVDRLNHVAPDWWYEIDRVLENSSGSVAGVVGTMYLGGTRRTEVGSVAVALPPGDALKRAISDFLKRAAARYGVGIDLWMKEEAADYVDDVGEGEAADGEAIAQPRTRAPRSSPTPAPIAPEPAAAQEAAPAQPKTTEGQTAPDSAPKTKVRKTAPAEPPPGEGLELLESMGAVRASTLVGAEGGEPQGDTIEAAPPSAADATTGPPAGAGDPRERNAKAQHELNQRFDLLGKAVGKLGTSAGVWKEVNARRDAGGAEWAVDNLRDLQLWQLEELAGEKAKAYEG